MLGGFEPTDYENEKWGNRRYHWTADINLCPYEFCE